VDVAIGGPIFGPSEVIVADDVLGSMSLRDELDF
jgi:hypothetical protein